MTELPPPSHPQPIPGGRPPGMGGAPAPRFELASPYGPHATEEGLDRVFAPVVLHAVREGWESMRAGRPDLYQGMAVYGSTVKGRIRAGTATDPGSDVDAYIFCDPDAAPQADVDRVAAADIRALIAPRLHAAIRTGSFPASQGILDQKNYHVVDMNPRLLDQALAEVLRGAAQGDSFGHSLLGVQRILPLFHMRLGSGNLRAYRGRVIETLSGHEAGGQVWVQLMDALAHREERRRRAAIYLPHSLEEAAGYFL